MKKQMFTVVSLLAAASMILVGCGTPATAAPVATAAPQVVVVTATPGPVTAPEGGEIAVIVKTGNSSFWQNVQTGAFAAQKELKAQTPKLSVTFLGAQSESNINAISSAIEAT